MADLYIDLTNGTDGGGGTLHDGLKEGNYAAIASTDNTHTYITQGALDNDADDNYNGDYIYNVTRSLGALISDYDGDDLGGNSVLTHAEIVGNVDTDTFYILRAIKTLGYYTSTLARSAGDIAYVRANTTETVAAIINCDEDGTANNLIYVIGCDSVTNDPWGDASDVKPIIDHNAGAYYLSINADEYWQFERMVFKNTTASFGNFTGDRNHVLNLIDCEFVDATSTGLRINSRATVYCSGCTFSNNDSSGFRGFSANAQFVNCVFDAGAGCISGIDADYSSFIEVIDSDFGQSNAFSGQDILAGYASQIYLRNCAHNDDFAVSRHSVVFEEDTDEVKGSNRIVSGAGNVTKDTTVNRSGAGGADSSAKMEPSSGVGADWPLTLNNFSKINFPFRIWCAAAATTVTVYIRALGTWGTYPTSSQLYLEVSYLSAAATAATRTSVQSNDVLSHASDWVAFDVAFTPVQAGWAYLNVFLNLYEDAGDGCYVDVKPIVT